MGTEANVEIARKFFAEWTAGDAEAAGTYLSDDVVWHTMGVEGELPLSGTMGKEGICTLIINVKAAMPAGLALKFIATTAQDNRVAAEVESYGEMTNGKIYTNLYHFLFVIEDGKITVLKEYCDTIHTKKTFVDP